MAGFLNSIRRFWNNITTSGAAGILSMEQKRRVVFLNSIDLAGMFILLAFSVVNYRDNKLLIAASLLSAFFILFFALIYMRIKKKFVLSGYIVVITIFFLFLFLLYTGGVEKSYSLWIQTFPLVAIFILGLRPGLIATGLYFIGISCLVFIPQAAQVEYGFSFGVRVIGSFILVFFFALFYENIRSQTQETLEKLSSDLLAAKKQTDSIMAHVDEGIFLLDSTLNIGSEYSRELEKIFGIKNLENRSLLNLLEKKIDEKIFSATKDYLDMFFKPTINIQLLEEINPLDRVELHFVESDFGFITKYLEFTFAPIISEEKTGNILCTVKDITEEIELAKKLKAQETRTKKQMEQLFQIINVDPAMLNEFILDAESELENINTLLKSDEKDYNLIINSIYQSVHAIKGNALLLGLSHTSKKLHGIEDEISEVREKELSWNELLKFTIRLSEIKNEINDVKDLVERVLAFRSNKDVKKIVQKDLLINAVERTINVLSKERNIEVNLVTDNFNSKAVTAKYRKVVKDILIQLTRNSLAHGIEEPKVRSSLAKEKVGTIIISSAVEDGKFTLSFKDDGRGLNAHTIKEKAKSIEAFKNMDFDGMTDQRVLSLIFHPRFSTAKETTFAAGRGIGLNLIKATVEKNGGSLKVRSARGKFCEFVITLPL
ncbi:MAG: Hpt domain-containing protein [Spirochaetales bacterium]|nr:Hpt domain-containing protein [Spirochaetales bacterium]